MQQDFNSAKNQNIKSKFIEREVYAQCNSMVEYIISKGFEDSSAPFTIDDVENYSLYQDVEYTHEGKTEYFTGTEAEKDVLIEKIKEDIETSAQMLADEEISEATHERNEEKYNEAIEALQNADTEPQEIYEWWIVSNWLMEKLRAKGQPVIDGYPNIWGRTCTGQAILLDHVISEICSDLEILEGQPNEWKNV